MIKYSNKDLKFMVATGFAIDLTNASSREDLPEPYTQVGYASGIYGCSGMLLRGDKTGTFYAITHRSTAVFIF